MPLEMPSIAAPLKLPRAWSTTLKMFLVGALVLLLMIPLGMIRGVLLERTSLRDHAELEIAKGWGGRQWLSPPFISALSSVASEREVDGKVLRSVHTRENTLLADKVESDVQMKIETRASGIYKVPVYTAQVRMRGSFAPEDLAEFARTKGMDLASAKLEFLASDLRGVRAIKSFSLGNIVLRASSQGQAFGSYTALGGAVSNSEQPERASELLNAALASRSPVPFLLEYELNGVQSLQVLPLARALALRMSGPWPDPSFLSGLLPSERTVSTKGFTARWNVYEFNRDFPQIALRQTPGERLADALLGVTLFQPGDIYQRNDRAGKYGFLFLAMSIAGFFLVEVLLGVRLHPMHYLLVGLALGLFYLLLLALSEQFGFAWAYLAAAVGITALIGGYTAAILHGRARGMIAGAVIGSLYGFLYVLMVREQYSLLLGSLGLFVLLALIMYLTRKIDWHGDGRSPVSEPPQPTV